MKKKEIHPVKKVASSSKKTSLKTTNRQFTDSMTNNKWAFVIILVIVLITYSGSFKNNLINFDDNTMMENIGKLKNSEIHLIKDSFTLDAMAGNSGIFYRPFQTFILLTLSFTGGYKSYVLFLLLVHVANSFLLFYLMTLLKMERMKSLLLALLFSAHPLFAPVINWIPSIGDASVTLFILISFVSFIKYTDNNNLKFLVLHLFSFFLALLSKEIALLFPLICFSYMFLVKGFATIKENYKFLIITFGLWIILPVIYVILRNANIHSTEAETAKIGLLTFISNLPVLFQFIFKFFIPAKLSLVSANSIIRISAGLVIAILLIFVALKQGKKNILLISALWLILFLVPTFIFKHPQYDYLEHRGYLPLISIVLIIAPIRWSKYEKISLSLLIILFCVLSYSRSGDFSNPIRFYASMSENEKVPMIYNNLAIEYDNIGDFQNASSNFDKAVNLNPEYVDAYVNRGNFKAQRLNNFGGAIKDYLLAIGYIEKNEILKRNIADYADVYNNMGTAKSRMNDIKGAMNDYTKAIEIKPDFAQAYYNRGILKAETLRDYESALMDLNRAIEIDSEYYDAFVNRGVIREVNLNDPEGALADYSKAISLRPDLALAYFNRGMFYKGRDNYTKACKDWQTAANLGHTGAAQMLRSYCK